MTILVAVEAIATGISIIGGILGLLGKKKAQKKAKKAEAITRVLVESVEKVADITKYQPERLSSDIKKVIQVNATKAGLETDLHTIVKDVTRAKDLIKQVMKH